MPQEHVRNHDGFLVDGLLCLLRDLKQVGPPISLTGQAFDRDLEKFFSPNELHSDISLAHLISVCLLHTFFAHLAKKFRCKFLSYSANNTSEKGFFWIFPLHSSVGVKYMIS